MITLRYYEHLSRGGRGDGDPIALSFAPHLAVNEYDGVAAAILTAAGIGALPPIVCAELLRDRKLVAVMPRGRLPLQDFSVIHLRNRHAARPARLFKDFAVRMAPTLFRRCPHEHRQRPLRGAWQPASGSSG